jgi:hypothetical protein
MENVKHSLKMILEGTFSDDIVDKLQLYEAQCMQFITEDTEITGARAKLRERINHLEKLLVHNQRLVQEVKAKEWKFAHPDEELEKLHKQEEKLKAWLDDAKDTDSRYA